MRRPIRRYTPRRRAKPGDSRSLDRAAKRRRRRVLQRVLLEAAELDSLAYERHQARLRKARGQAARLRAYERTVAELGLGDRAEELLDPQPRPRAQRGGDRAA